MAEKKDVGREAYDILRKRDIKSRSDSELLAFRKRQQKALEDNEKNYATPGVGELSRQTNEKYLKPDIDAADEEIARRGLKP